MVMYTKIRRMFFREYLSISEIARRTTLIRNTIKKWLKTLLVWSTIYNYIVIYTFNLHFHFIAQTIGRAIFATH